MGQPKLSAEQILTVRTKYQDVTIPTREIREKYGISHFTLIAYCRDLPRRWGALEAIQKARAAGETLASIAKRFGVTAKTVMSYTPQRPRKGHGQRVAEDVRAAYVRGGSCTAIMAAFRISPRTLGRLVSDLPRRRAVSERRRLRAENERLRAELARVSAA